MSEISDRTILVIHAGKAIPHDLVKLLKGDQWNVATAKLKDTGAAVSNKGADCVLLHLDAEGHGDVGEALEIIKSYDDNLPLIAVAKEAGFQDAVNVMKAGAFDFFTYPLNVERLKSSVAHAMHIYGLTKKVFLLETQMGMHGSLDEMVGQSAKMQEVYETVQMVARSNATVLILGESGTGKELVAKAVHRLGPRSKRVFIDINCGAIPRELLENELFGHEKGAYTGADRRYVGSCERADGGTLFLDEISEMDPALQVKMLRFLQERNFMRVGGEEPISVDVKVIAATNRDLEQEVALGRFREDLFYRLNVVPVRVPPLRERRDDIPILAKHFLNKYSAKHERMFIDFAPQAMEAFVSYDWPGNVRELENIVERITVLNNDSKVKFNHLPAMIQQARQKGAKEPGPKAVIPTEKQHIVPLKMVEKYAIEAALTRCLGNVAEAANKLKVSQATLYRKIKQYGLKV